MESVNRSGQMGISLEHAWFRKTNTIQGQSCPWRRLSIALKSSAFLPGNLHEDALGNGNWENIYTCGCSHDIFQNEGRATEKGSTPDSPPHNERELHNNSGIQIRFFGLWPDKRKIFLFISESFFSAYFCIILGVFLSLEFLPSCAMEFQ